jgi:hypothetical protein
MDNSPTQEEEIGFILQYHLYNVLVLMVIVINGRFVLLGTWSNMESVRRVGALRSSEHVRGLSNNHHGVRHTSRTFENTAWGIDWNEQGYTAGCRTLPAKALRVRLPSLNAHMLLKRPTLGW